MADAVPGGPWAERSGGCFIPCRGDKQRSLSILRDAAALYGALIGEDPAPKEDDRG